MFGSLIATRFVRGGALVTLANGGSDPGVPNIIYNILSFLKLCLALVSLAINSNPCSHRVLSFLQSSELGLPQNPAPAGECAPPHPLVRVERAHSLAGEGVGEGIPNSNDIHIHCGTLYL